MVTETPDGDVIVDDVAVTESAEGEVTVEEVVVVAKDGVVEEVAAVTEVSEEAEA